MSYRRSEKLTFDDLRRKLSLKKLGLEKEPEPEVNLTSIEEPEEDYVSPGRSIVTGVTQIFIGIMVGFIGTMVSEAAIEVVSGAVNATGQTSMFLTSPVLDFMPLVFPLIGTVTVLTGILTFFSFNIIK